MSFYLFYKSKNFVFKNLQPSIFLPILFDISVYCNYIYKNK
ncbi:hypothetical protein HMPREF1548_05139 [Clostridium sp. KLE 1755]|nr:hypothetical protein HMPREF1548_05139 [Clostridium sp. KLE 1755]